MSRMLCIARAVVKLTSVNLICAAGHPRLPAANQTWMASKLGHLPEFRTLRVPEVGYTRFPGTSPAMRSSDFT